MLLNKKFGILVLHGMGETPEDYDKHLKSNLERELGPVWDEAAYVRTYYQPGIQKLQDKVWERMTDRHQLDWSKLRRFFLFSFSDAATLEHRSYTLDGPYRQTHETILNALKFLRAELVDAKAPVILIAQSLGGEVISNYIWDADAEKGIWTEDDLKPGALDPDERDFLRLKTKKLILTTGCNIPLFVSGFAQIEAIQKPADTFRWFNYYDRDDPLGWPLKPLSDSYEAVVDADVEVNSGGFLTSWNPMSHSDYWKDREVIDHLCARIREAGAGVFA